MTKQEFELLFSELEESGKSIKDFMADKKLPVHRYYYWKKRYNGINSQDQSNEFIQIGPGQSINSIIRLEYPNGVAISFQSNPGTKALLKLINRKH